MHAYTYIIIFYALIHCCLFCLGKGVIGASFGEKHGKLGYNMVSHSSKKVLCMEVYYLGTRRLCLLFYLLCYAALLKNLPIMLKLMLNIYLLCSNYAQYFYLSSHVFLITLYFMEK